ncbi:hypothetical protein CDA63_05155 [Hymenobacter amundsenii]|uniref:BLUF domain-containing protein n=1 Tax=Hymenobacter amundsenii TaxID=2006685 RepID=A0A246FN65_9BACT|nr:BLUF domain-containing protein [Hymenobacter amundsenii]OWP64119.1 hypothetical protein CDA63_05155 [Hymenobacter amundsenii]
MKRLHHLIYQSRVLRALSATELERLRDQSQQANQRAGITGILWYDGQRFLHILEGPGAVVRELFARIRLDCRHADVQVLANGPIAQRQFQCWEMAILRRSGRLLKQGDSCEPTPDALADHTLQLLLQDFQHTVLSAAVRYRP